MKHSEYLNTKNHMKRDFEKTQAQDVIKLLDHIADIEENARLLKSQLERLEQIMHLLDSKHDTKVSVLASVIEKAALERGINIDIPDDLIVKPKEEKQDEGISG